MMLRICCMLSLIAVNFATCVLNGSDGELVVKRVSNGREKLSALLDNLRNVENVAETFTASSPVVDKTILTNVTTKQIKQIKKPIKLNTKQSLIMNQVLTVYGLSGDINPLCKNHSEAFKDGLRTLEPWALKMFDSSSKLQSGMLLGNFMEYGAFSQCLEIYHNSDYGPLKGKYCTLKITPSENIIKQILSYRNVSSKRFEKVRMIITGASLLWSVCVPQSCTHDEVLQHFTKIILSLTEGLTLNMSITHRDCAVAENQLLISKSQWIAIGALSFIILIVIISTLLDIYLTQKNRSKSVIIDIFSAFGNSKKMFASGGVSSELNCLHGIRFLSTCYVVLGHRFLMPLLFPHTNTLKLMQWVLYYSSTIIIGGTVSVDTFLLVSGLLVAYLFFEHMSKGAKFNLPMFYLNRYLRIVPAYAVVVLVYATLLPLFGSGPLWKNIVASLEIPCKHFWWAALLQIQTYTNPKYLCVLQTWSLQCDTIFYLLSPLIMYPLWKWPVFGYINFAFFYVISVAVNFYLAWINQYEGSVPVSNRLSQTQFFLYHYITPHTRASPYIIGIGLAYALFKTKGKKVKMNLALVISGWICALICISGPVVGTHRFQLEDHVYNRVEACFFVSMNRSVWTLGLVWIIWCCHHGYGGPINFLLSLHVFRVLGRIGYGIFLIHFGYQLLTNAAAETPKHFSNFDHFNMFLGDIVIMIFVSFIFTLCFEAPFVKMQTVLLRRNTKKILPEEEKQ